MTDNDGGVSSLSKQIITRVIYHNQTGANNQTTIDLQNETDTIILINTSQSTTVNISKYSGNPTGENIPNDITAFGDYIDIDVENKSAIVWPITIMMFYTQNDLSSSHINETQLLGIFFWNDTSGEWQLYSDTGVNTSYNQSGYDGYCWANVWHLTPLILGGDIQPPSKVTGLAVTNVHDGKLNLVWNPATDNDAVDHYRIYRNGAFLINQTSVSYQDTGLTDGQSYTYQVSAVDTVGNEGIKSDPKTGMPTINNPPTMSNPNPANGSTNIPISTSSLSISIQDPEGDHFNWNITTVPNIGSISGTNASNGTKTCAITGLSYSTTYTWTVRASDGVRWTNQSYQFATLSNGGGGGGGPGGGGGEMPPAGPQNQYPIANASAGEPYKGFVNSEILFDGSRSYDPDGNITKWFWVFGDNTNGTGKTVQHAYSKVGTYTVTLTVTDNLGATNTDTTTCVILQPNKPPTIPIITGPTNGTKNTMYIYTAISTDPDNDTIQYTFDWGSPISQTSGFLPNGTSFTVNHSWASAGRYIITVTVTDNHTVSSSKITVYIDAIQTGDIGYLIDDNGDGTYDTFRNVTTSQNTVVGKSGSNYLIDSNGDGKWEYTFNKTGGLALYQPPKTPGFEVIIIIGAMVLVMFWKRKRRDRD